MSLTSYRAAPPRVTHAKPWLCVFSAFARALGMVVLIIVVRLVFGRPGDDLLSQVLRHSTIGAEEFNGRVRDGIGFRLLARATRPAKHNLKQEGLALLWRAVVSGVFCGQDFLADEHGQMRAIKPIKRLVPVSCTGRPASTSGLSTWWSTTAFEGEFILRWVSRLDAFSGYPDRT